MRIFTLIDDLKRRYENNNLTRKNGTILLGLGTIPNAEHMLYKGLPYETINDFLISEYNHKFPDQYAEFLQYSNGADLFIKKLSKGKIHFASVHLSVYGLPRTQPFGRPADMEEPFDVRIEDLARHPRIPSNWLKCGRYKTEIGFGNEAYFYIDTKTEQVYACRKDDYKIIESWANLDECLCDVFLRFHNA